jgi:hypothetical protein
VEASGGTAAVGEGEEAPVRGRAPPLEASRWPSVRAAVAAL